MATSVKLRTAIPSISAFGKSLGLSEKQQKALITLVKRNGLAGQFTAGRKSIARLVKPGGSEKVFRAGKR